MTRKWASPRRTQTTCLPSVSYYHVAYYSSTERTSFIFVMIFASHNPPKRSTVVGITSASSIVCNAHCVSAVKLGRKHPDPVVETASLSSVEPVDVTYSLALPDETVRSGLLSALQLEAVVYASQAHEHTLPDGTRAGFLIGDGAGVGKGRTIAGIIFENHLRGRKRALWVSVSNDLKYDAERDLRDIGAGKIEVHSLSKVRVGSLLLHVTTTEQCS